MERFGKLILTVAIAVLVSLGMSSCGNADEPPTDSGNAAGATAGKETETAPNGPSDSEDTAAGDQPSAGSDGDTDDSGATEECFVHLFDDEDFDEDDDHFRLTKPGRYGNLSQLPGADKDWHDEADSIRVGPGATVIIWDKPQFQGKKTQLAAGTEIADLEEEPESLELRCS